MRLAAPLTLLGLAVLTLSVFSGPGDAHDNSLGRLIFTDREQPMLGVLDLDSGQVTHRFELPAAGARLEAGDDGRYVFVVLKDTVRVLDTGISFESHGDHRDVFKGAVRMLELSLDGERPAHVTSGGGWSSVFFDGPRPQERIGDAKAALLDMASLKTGAPMVRDWRSEGPQHGLAVPLGDGQWAMTVPNPDYVSGKPGASSLPMGIEVLEAGDGWRRLLALDGQDGSASCREIHGHAALGQRHFFGCAVSPGSASGALLVLERPEGGGWQASGLSYPDRRRVSTLKAAKSGAVIVASLALDGRADALLRIAADADTIATADILPVPDAQAVCQFEVSADGQRAANLLADGTLRILQLFPQWREVARLDLLPPFDCSFNAPAPRPMLAVQGSTAFVSDPPGGRVLRVDLAGARQLLEMKTGGVPGSISVVP